jgi:predicted PurR-regulated permease PerM
MASVRLEWSRTAALWVLALIALAFFLRATQSLLIPIAIGILLSYALAPLVTALERCRIPRAVAAAVVLLVLVGITGWSAYSLRDEVVRATEALPKAARRLNQLVLATESGPTANIQEAVRELNNGAASEPSSEPQATIAPTDDGPPGGIVQRFASSVVALAGHATVVVFLMFFVLSSGPAMRRRALEIAGPGEAAATVSTIVNDITSQIQRFLLVRLATGLLVWLATWAVLAWLQTPQAAVWGFLAGLFNSIPYFGPVIVSGGLLVVGLVQDGDLNRALTMSGAALVITSIEGWVVTPPLMGRVERMNVVVVFVGLLFWTWVWGAWGTILAVPMLVIVKAISDHVPALRPISRVMGPL